MTNSLASALAKFYVEVSTIEKGSKAQYGNFASLSDVLSMVNPALSKCGLSVTQTFEDDASDRFLVTTLRCDGESVSSKTKLITEGGRGNPLHTWGGAVTYQRRYALLSILNIAAGIEDTDGAEMAPEAAPEPAKKAPAAKKAAPAPAQPESGSEPLTEPQRQELFAAIGATSDEYRKALIKEFVKTFSVKGDKISTAITSKVHFDYLQQYFADHPA